MKLNFDSRKQIIFLGDHHGTWPVLFDELNRRHITDCYLISVGDVGIGFIKPQTSQLEHIHELNQRFKKLGINFLGIRGNHDDPNYFNGRNRVVLSNFELIEDYTIAQYGPYKIQFIGGATSIDRTIRQEGMSYWREENLNFVPDKCEPADVLVTHTAPNGCFPHGFASCVTEWFEEDTNLEKDLIKEKELMSILLEIVKPKLHVYGHFHASADEVVKNCRHRLLNICEMWGMPFEMSSY